MNVVLNFDQGVQLINCISHRVEHFTCTTFNPYLASPSLPHSNGVLHAVRGSPTHQHALPRKLCPNPKPVQTRFKSGELEVADHHCTRQGRPFRLETL